MTLPYLSDEEIAGLCEPYTQPAAQIRYLRSLGLLIYAKPNGKPLLARSEFERVLGAARYAKPTAEPAWKVPMHSPNREAFLLQFAGRKAKKSGG